MRRTPGLALRLRVPNTGAMVELSSKFGADPGEAVDLIAAAFAAGLVVEGLSFHVGSQTTNYDNFVQALHLAAGVFKEAALRGFDKLNILDIGGGFPAPYNESVRPFEELARTLNSEFDRLFPPRIEILAEPGRFLVATAATAVVKIIGKAVRDGKRCYYVDDGVYHTFSGIVFDHCQYHLKSFKRGADGDLLRVRADLRRPGHHFPGRGLARPAPGRISLQREHRRLQPRLVDLLQRLSAGEGFALECMTEERSQGEKRGVRS